MPDRPTPVMTPSVDALPPLDALLAPETALEKHLLSLPEFQQGLRWGEPRFGHPEGKVAWHVREVLDNIDLIPGLAAADRERLRLVAFAHDTFKYAEDRGHPRNWARHHGMLARRFMENFTADDAVLDLIETHDDAYYAWLGTKAGHNSASQTGAHTLEALLARVGHYLQLYYFFFKCDTQTGDKTQGSLKWFEKNVVGIQVAPIRENKMV